jgi:hypothetical protein
LPDILNTGEYILSFIANAGAQSYEKKYPLQIRGFEGTVQQTNTAGRKLITKVSKERVKPGETLFIYVGVVSNSDEVKAVRIILPNQADAIATKTGNLIWRTKLTKFTAGRNDYRAVVTFKDGTTAERNGVFWYDGKTSTVVKPVPKSTTTIKPKDNTPQRLNKVYYPVEIMLSPAKPALGTVLQIRAKYAAPEVNSVYADIRGQIIPLKKSGGIWRAEYTLPAKSSELYIKIYSKDAEGNLSMTEKLLRF